MELFRQKLVGNCRCEPVQNLGGNGVQGVDHAEAQGNGTVIFPAVVLGIPGGPLQLGVFGVGKAGVRGHKPQVQRRTVDGHGLDSGPRRTASQGTGGPVQAAGHVLLPYAALQTHNVPGLRVDDHHAGLQGLIVAGQRNILYILVDSIHFLLDVHIHTGINLIAAVIEHGGGLFAGDAGGLLEKADDVLHHGVHIVGVGLRSQLLLLGVGGKL